MLLFSVFIIILFFQKKLILIDPVKLSNGIYYIDPILEVKNMNLTLAASFPLERGSASVVSGADSIGVAMAICQADRINQKLYPQVKFNGIINIAIQSYGIADSIGQYSILKLLSNSLYNSTTGKSLSSDRIYNLAGFFGTQSSGVNRINGLGISGYQVPFVNPGTNEQPDYEDRFSIGYSADNRTFYSVRETSVYNSFFVMLDIMKAYNWSICGNIFQDNVLGLSAEQYAQTYVNFNKFPIFVCNRIFTPNDKNNSKFIKEICDCLTGIDTVRVLNLWLNSVLAFDLIRTLRKNCAPLKDFVFIVSGDSEPLPPNIYFNTEYFKTTLIIRPFGPLNVTQYLNECIETATPQAKVVVKSLVDSNLEKLFKCFRKNDSNSNLPKCPKSIMDRKESCLCTGFEYNPEDNPYTAQNFFFPDSISTFASVIDLLQNNCSLIQELVKFSGDLILNKINLCSLKYITPEILGRIISFANFTGFTGKITFPNRLENVREIKPYYLYTVRTTIAEAVLVGNFTIAGYYLNKSAIYLPNGNNTISELVPQDPSIQYAVIAVFFGIMIFLLVLCLIAYAILIYYFNHPVIKKNTPLMSLLVLTGTTIVVIGAIVACTGINDASCIIFLFCSNIGLALSLGAIIAKNYRLYKIFNNRSANAVDITDLRLFLIVFVIFLFYTILSIVFVITGFKAYINESSSNPLYLYYECVIDNRFWEIFLAAIDEISLVMLRFIGLGLAWCTRKVFSAYSESKAVATVLILYICMDISFLPLFYTMQSGTDSAIYKVVIRMIYLSLIAFVTLAILFYARFYKIYQFQKRLKKRISSTQI